MEKAECTTGLQACMGRGWGTGGGGTVSHLIRVTNCSYLAYSLSRKASSKHGIRMRIKKN